MLVSPVIIATPFDAYQLNEMFPTNQMIWHSSCSCSVYGMKMHLARRSLPVKYISIQRRQQMHKTQKIKIEMHQFETADNDNDLLDCWLLPLQWLRLSELLSFAGICICSVDTAKSKYVCAVTRCAPVWHVIVMNTQRHRHFNLATSFISEQMSSRLNIFRSVRHFPMQMHPYSAVQWKNTWPSPYIHSD